MHFDPNMTVQEAMFVHPQVAEVFAAFHLGGCSSCGISEIETVAQVCMGYGVDIAMLLEVLEGLMDDMPDPANKNETTKADEKVANVE
ncbi:MAG: disulfide oxidoreductase [Candidatus Hydrogenedentota bacterium]|nr:MAG: disulfide oxidoreductase [Candidatus Hydrogenedentota bacterium]